jgi:glucose-1-phosphate thymidylyltransferase
MRIIVPMAGMGKRMRPHTLTVPKPLIKVAGKPIVQRLVEELAALCTEPIEEVAYIVGHFGEAVEAELIAIAERLGASGSIHYQDEALGTAHAILCAKSALKGKVIVAFADTLFKAQLKLDDTVDGVLWVKQLPNPEQFGVVQLNASGHIINFIEKPKTFVSDLAMIGIYYFKDGAVLADELQYLIDHNIIKGNEYQLPDALKNMTEKGMKFVPGAVDDWMDCGNKNATVETNARILNYYANDKNLVASSIVNENSIIIQPCYIGENVTLRNCIVGPHAAIGAGSSITNSLISNSIIQENAIISNANITNSMLGQSAEVSGTPLDLSISDYSTIKN